MTDFMTRLEAVLDKTQTTISATAWATCHSSHDVIDVVRRIAKEQQPKPDPAEAEAMEYFKHYQIGYKDVYGCLVSQDLTSEHDNNMRVLLDATKGM